jgi:hypothetical protein
MNMLHVLFFHTGFHAAQHVRFQSSNALIKARSQVSCVQPLHDAVDEEKARELIISSMFSTGLVHSWCLSM